MSDDGPVDPAKALMKTGYAQLNQRQYDAALATSEALIALRHTGGFEIGALAHAAKGHLEAAVSLLEDGVAKAPTVWLNWQLLGNYRSDLGRLDDAAQAYARALECPNVWRHSLLLNQAILANRRDDGEGALALLDAIDDPRLAERVLHSRLVALRQLRRADEAEARAAAFLATAPDARGLITALMLRARLDRGDDKAAVRRAAVDAWQTRVDSRDLMALIRDLDNAYSARAVYWRVLVEGRRADGSGFFASYDVVADDPDEALALLRDLDRRDAGAVTLVVSEAHNLDQRPTQPKGVYVASPRSHFAAA